MVWQTVNKNFFSFDSIENDKKIYPEALETFIEMFRDYYS